MEPALNSLAAGLPWLIFYLVVVTVIYLVGIIIYTRLTPHKELELVQEGNMAAAISFSALVIGLALPLAACLVNKFGLIDVAIWGTVSLFLQLFLFRVTDAIFRGMPERIEANEVPAATVLAAFKLSGSLILAVAIIG
jgi:putative membrane protein